MKSNQMSGGIKGLLFAHCEKIVAFLLLALAGYLVYSSLGIKGINQTHSELSSAVSQTSSAFEQSRWLSIDEEYKQLSYAVQTGDGQINGAAYMADGSLNPNVVPPTVDRTDPELLPAMSLQVSSVTGLMAFADEEVRRERELEERRREEALEAERSREAESDRDERRGRDKRGNNNRFGGRDDEEDMKGRREVPNDVNRREEGVDLQGDERIDRVSCAVVLAKVPVLEQYKIYMDTLEDAQGFNPSADIPEYRGFFIERSEVIAGQEPDWQPVTVSRSGRSKNVVTDIKIQNLITDWVAGQEPIMDNRFEHPALTMPLPPLVGQPWQANQVVHDDIPLMAETEALQDAMDDDMDPELIEDPDSPFGRSEAGGAMERGPRMNPRMMRREGMGGPMRRSQGGNRGGDKSFDEEISHYMVRFFDFTVIPGRRYQYRLQMVLTDVNKRNGLRRSYLAKDVAERISAGGGSDIVRAEWSQPSPVVSVPLAGDVFVAEATIPKADKPNSEPSVNLLVNTFDLDEDRRAMRAETIDKFYLGSVMNFKKDIETLSSDQQWLIERDTFPFRTGITLCDVSGGDQISRDEKAPVKVLFMDSTGSLFVRNQAEDKDKVERYKSIYEEDRSRNRDNERSMFNERGGRRPRR